MSPTFYDAPSHTARFEELKAKVGNSAVAWAQVQTAGHGSALVD